LAWTGRLKHISNKGAPLQRLRILQRLAEADKNSLQKTYQLRILVNNTLRDILVYEESCGFS
jgi:hypothetical protein